MLTAAEQQWVAVQKAATSRAGPPVVTLCGPSGVGKSTAALALPSMFQVYLEDVRGNPYLQALLNGDARFDAAANQRWFLSRLHDFVRASDPNRPLVLDQDPAAIVLVYAKLFLEDGLLTNEQHDDLIVQLMDVERVLGRWRLPRIVLGLHAPSEVLYERARIRSVSQAVPPLQWFERVRAGFLNLFDLFPGAIRVSIVEACPEDIVRTVQQNTADRLQD